MTKCWFYLQNDNTQDTIECVGSSDDDTSFNLVKLGPQNGSLIECATLGCPSATESDHWCWFYFKVSNSDLIGYFSVFTRLRHSGDVKELGMGWCGNGSDTKLPERSPPSSGQEEFTKTVPRIGRLYWAPDKYRYGPTGAVDSPIVRITYTG